MGIEVERKFIVPLEHHALFLGLPPGLNQMEIVQAYLSSEKGKTVRLRIERRAYTLKYDDSRIGRRAYTLKSNESTRWEESCWITIKGPSLDGGLTRSEWEEKFSVQAAEEIIAALNPPRLQKTRNFVENGEDIWEVDVLKVNTVAGRAPAIWSYLVVAEFEHGDPEKVKGVALPPWVGKEVTGDSRFSMVNLVTEAQRDLAWRAAYAQ